MQMRLGKTLVVIRYLMSRILLQPRFLVVTPSEGLWAWKRELEMEKQHFTQLTGSRKERLLKLNNSESVSWFLINYEGVRTIENELKKIPWNALVLDESRRIANPKAKTTKALQSFPQTSNQKRIILSGEPAPETPLEYFEQYKFLYGNFVGLDNFWKFRNIYFRELAPHEWVPKTGYLENLKRHIRRSGFFLTRHEAGMPDKKIYEVRTLKFPPGILKVYNEIKKDFVASLEGKTFSTKWVPVQYLWLQQLASGWLSSENLWQGKTLELLDLLGGELLNEQVVVWFRFNNALKECANVLREFGVAKITGEESRDEREASINKFREGKIRILLVQIKCGKTALDLSCASTAIYFTNSHSLEERKQSEDRILNPAKKDPLLYIDLVTEGTVEEDILDVLRQKSNEAKFYRNNLIEKLRRSHG